MSKFPAASIPNAPADAAGQGAGGSSETGYAAKHTPSPASEATLNTDKLEEVKKLFTAHLENKGLRKTGERYAILEEIYARSGHFDVDELYAGMKERGLQVSRATVYNTLAEQVTHAALLRAIWAAPTAGLLKDARLFDVYRAKPARDGSGAPCAYFS